MYGEDDIKVISKADTVEYFKSNNDCEHGFSFICGKVLSMRDWKEKWYDVELECLGVVFNLNIFKESVPNIEVGCHLQLEVSASIGTEQ